MRRTACSRATNGQVRLALRHLAAEGWLRVEGVYRGWRIELPPPGERFSALPFWWESPRTRCRHGHDLTGPASVYQYVIGVGVAG